MSELAFNLNGEPFDVPSQAVGWKVRRMKSKGAPEVVYSREGGPLLLPIDADIDDLRHAARLEGRYRLDPVDDASRVIVGAPAGYVCVQAVDSASSTLPSPAPVSTDSVAVEAMRHTIALAKSVVDSFPMMLEAASTLIRAADGAGMPARAPRPIEVVKVDADDGEEEEEDDDDDEVIEDEPANEPPAKASGLQGIIETLAPYVMPAVMPAIMSAIASGKIKIPGGVGAMLGGLGAGRMARSTSAAAKPTSTPGDGPAPGPRDPAPATGASVPPTGRASSWSPYAGAAEPTAHSARADEGVRVADRQGAPPPAAPAPSTVGDTRTSNAEAVGEPSTGAPGSAAQAPDELPTLDAAKMAHFAAIHAALTLHESMLAREIAAELSPDELRRWIAELGTLSVEAGVAKIRAVLGTTGDDAQGGSVS